MGEGEQLAGETKKDWEGSFTMGGPIRKDRVWFFGAYDYLRSASLPPRWSLESESWNRYSDAKVSATPFKNHLVWGSYHYESNDGNGWSWGSEPAWDTTMSYGSTVKNHTVAAQWQWSPKGNTAASAKFLGFRKDDQPYLPERPSRPSRFHQLVEVGRLRHQRSVPVRGRAASQPADHAGRHLALRGRIPGAARHQVRRAVHEGRVATGSKATSRTT